MRDIFRLDMPADLASIKVGRSALEAFLLHNAKSLGFTELDGSIRTEYQLTIEDIKVALSEAISNAVIYGYPDDPGHVYVSFSLNDDILTITVKDKGVGIPDVEKAMTPLFTTNPECSGMGFTIMDSFMDSISVRSTEGKGTTVKLKKKLDHPKIFTV